MQRQKYILSCFSVSKQDHKITSCLCFAFLTHGHKGGELFAADRPYPFKDVTTLIENSHPSLVGKPKIFIVQVRISYFELSPIRNEFFSTRYVTAPT